MYASVADLRDEDVSVAQASDDRLLALIDEAGRAIDSFTGWLFEPRALTLRLDGRGTPSIEPPVPPIELAALSVGGSAVSIAPEDLVIVGAPVQPGFDAPRITRTRRRVFPKGTGNVEEVLEEAKRDLVYPKRINPLTTGPGLPRFIDGSRTLKGDGNFPYVLRISQDTRALEAELAAAGA